MSKLFANTHYSKNSENNRELSLKTQKKSTSSKVLIADSLSRLSRDQTVEMGSWENALAVEILSLSSNCIFV